jgi:hypothetical protein
VSHWHLAYDRVFNTSLSATNKTIRQKKEKKSIRTKISDSQSVVQEISGRFLRPLKRVHKVKTIIFFIFL